MYTYIKRVLDFTLSIVGCIILFPVFLLLIICIKIDSRGPVLFKQRRVGKNKVYFYILKFRTMKIDAPKDIPTHLLEKPEQYITKMGEFLRKTSLDELPQLWNILIGNMSVVGPRPALWNQYDLIEERDKYGANNLRPGLTGWAQINGRDELPISIKARYDGEYAQKISFSFDFICFFRTISSIIKHEGIIEGGTGKLKAAQNEVAVTEINIECEPIEDLVSIITPMYNAERFIAETIRSVLSQTYSCWEMIIVDDGSTDHSHEIVERYVHQDNRIHLIRLDKNYGIAQARNAAINQSNGRFLAFLDSDDVWLPEKLMIQLEFMKKSKCAFCFSGCFVIDQYGNFTKKERKVPKSISYNKLLYGNVIPCLTVLLDRQRFKNIKFQEINHEDYATWLELLKQTDIAMAVQKPLAKYRIYQKTVSSNKFKSIFWVWNIFRQEQKLNVFKSIYCIIIRTFKAFLKWY